MHNGINYTMKNDLDESNFFFIIIFFYIYQFKKEEEKNYETCVYNFDGSSCKML